MIEINRAGSDWVYRIDPDDPKAVQHKPNRHGARWTSYLRRDTPKEARAALLQLSKPDNAKGGTL